MPFFSDRSRSNLQPNACTVEAHDDRQVLVLEFNDRLKDELNLEIPAYVELLKDLNRSRRIVRSIGLGQAEVRPYRGKDYLVVKKFPRDRFPLKGTRYLARNAQVAHITGAVGNGLVRSAIRAPGLSILTTTGWEVVKEILREPAPGEDPKWSGPFFRNLAVEVLKASVASAAGWGVAALIASLFAAPVVVPILVGAAVGFGVSVFLDGLHKDAKARECQQRNAKLLAEHIEKDRETWPRNPDGTFAPRFGVDYPIHDQRLSFA